MNAQSRINLHTGNTMPVIGLGTWKLTDKTADIIIQALELGYRMIDTSGDYGTQPGIAAGLEMSKVARDEIFITTKVEEHEDAYKSAGRQVSELGLEYADLILLHRPPQSGSGVKLWEALIRAKQEGVARDIGVSNYSTGQIEELVDATGETPVVNQIEWSPFGHSKQMYDWCRANDVVIQAYSPMSHGQRVGDETIAEIGAKYGKTAAQVMIRWSIQHGTVPLPKANNPEHLRENLDVFDFELSEDDDRILDGLNENYSSMGSLPYVNEKEPAFRERLERD